MAEPHVRCVWVFGVDLGLAESDSHPLNTVVEKSIVALVKLVRKAEVIVLHAGLHACVHACMPLRRSVDVALLLAAT